VVLGLAVEVRAVARRRPPKLQGYLAHKKQQPPPRTTIGPLGIVVLQGPRRGVFLMSEVPLYTRVEMNAADREAGGLRKDLSKLAS